MVVKELIRRRKSSWRLIYGMLCVVWGKDVNEVVDLFIRNDDYMDEFDGEVRIIEIFRRMVLFMYDKFFIK